VVVRANTFNNWGCFENKRSVWTNLRKKSERAKKMEVNI